MPADAVAVMASLVELCDSAHLTIKSVKSLKFSELHSYSVTLQPIHRLEVQVMAHQAHQIRKLIFDFIVEKFSVQDLRGISVAELLKRNKAERAELLQRLIDHLVSGTIASKFGIQGTHQKDIVKYARKILSETLLKTPLLSQPNYPELYECLSKKELEGQSPNECLSSDLRAKGLNDSEISLMNYLSYPNRVHYSGRPQISVDGTKKQRIIEFRSSLSRLVSMGLSTKEEYLRDLLNIDLQIEKMKLAEILVFLHNNGAIQLSTDLIQSLSAAGIAIEPSNENSKVA